MFCKQCGKPIDDGQELCEECKVSAGSNNAQANQTTNNGQTYNANPNVQTSPKSKMAAGLLGIFLGAWGIHNFYLGYTGKGVAQLVLTLCTCGVAGIWGFIEGILILTGSINTDANGNPLGE